MKPRRKIGIGPEGKIHKDFAGLLRQYEAYGKLDCLHWSYDAAGEKRSILTASLLKAKGLKKGGADYVFYQKIYVGGVFAQVYHIKIIFIEFKSEKGKQSESQIEFEKKFEDIENARYYVARSVAEGIKILEKEQILIK